MYQVCRLPVKDLYVQHAGLFVRFRSEQERSERNEMASLAAQGVGMLEWTMLTPAIPALILAPMDGITDAPMRALQGETGAFTFAVTEFLRVSSEVPPKKVFHRHVPELGHGGLTPTGLPVQVQLLGGDPGRMGEAAAVACEAGAKAIDINFGCPAPTVNRHDGGATLLKYPTRIRDIVAAVRAAVPRDIPVSAKLRLGWDRIDSIFENAERAAEGGASWLTIHGRTRAAGYAPPAHWGPIGAVRERLGLPVVANGDIWTIEAFRRCRDETGCRHFMLGRGALADPTLAWQVAIELGSAVSTGAAARALDRAQSDPDAVRPWICRFERLIEYTHLYQDTVPNKALFRLKQWLRIASVHGRFGAFEAIKRAQSVDEVFATLAEAENGSPSK